MTSLAATPSAAQSSEPPARKRVLMLTHRLPYPPDRGDRIRSYHMLKFLASRFDVAIACTSEEPAWLQHHQLLSTIARQVAIQPILQKTAKFKGVAAMLSGKAVTPTVFYRNALADTIAQWHKKQPFDAVLTFCTGMIEYARLLTHPGRVAGTHRAHGPIPRHVLDLVDVDSAKWEAYARSTWPPMKWVYAREGRKLRVIESGRDDHFDAVTVVSQAEADAYRKYVGDHPGLRVVGNGVDTNYFKPLPDPNANTLCFVGVLNYKPNADSIHWFVHQVLPLVRKRVTDAKLLIVGRNPTQRITDLAKQPGVEVVGSVPDVRVYMAQASAVIAPLQIARGVQNKVLEAMAAARVVICSPSASEGLDALDGLHLLVAKEPEQWARQIEHIFTDRLLRLRMGQAARTQVEERYSWESRLAPMVDILNG